MSHELKEGVELKMVITPPDAEGDQAVYRVDANHHLQVDCSKITVREQPGQMGMVPWALCETKDGESVMVNLANVESVDLA